MHVWSSLDIPCAIVRPAGPPPMMRTSVGLLRELTLENVEIAILDLWREYNIFVVSRVIFLYMRSV